MSQVGYVAEALDGVRSGATTITQVAKDTREAIAAGNRELNAFISEAGDHLEEQAPDLERRLVESPDLPLLGVPISIKDNIVTRGLPTTCASRILEGYVPPYDATAVVRLKAAGALVAGKTNMDEFGMGSSTEFSTIGPARNPHDLDRVPGGSSGGSAAAVAAGIVPAALGSDTGGSIRQPASYCGIVGVKPTYGRVSRYGLVAYASSLEQIGTLTRTVVDAARVLQVIAGRDERDSTSLDVPIPDLIEATQRSAEGLRVGVVKEMLGDGTQADVARAVREAAGALAEAGGSVETVSIASTDSALAAYYLIATAEASSNLSRFDGVRYGLRVDGRNANEMMTSTRGEGFGVEVKRRIMLGTFALSSGYYDPYYGQAQKVRTLIQSQFRAALGTVDVLVGPTAPSTAFAIGELVDDPVQLYQMDVCTIMANLVGIPAASVPWGADGAGLPIGVQVMASAFEEATLLRAAAAIERSAPAAPSPRVFYGTDFPGSGSARR
jgi:aspartyl-tRNA(Asn)/glutamyl-tRNA(Gln) amidotransferase subunit A